MFDAKKNGTPISFSQIVARFEPKFHKPFARAQDQLQPAFVLGKGKRVAIDGEILVDCTRPNIVIDGDAVIDGNLVMFVDEGFGGFVIVTGNLEADAICLQGFPELIVGGDVKCKNGIVGIRGDDGGFFDVGGKVKAPVIVCDSYFNFAFEGPVTGVTINTSYRKWPKSMTASYTHANVADVVAPKFLDGEEGLDAERVFAAIEKGKSILTKGGARAGRARA